MKHPLHIALDNKEIILASQSPRRKLLLGGIDIDFKVIVKDGIDESFPEDLSKTEIPEFLSKKKASAYKGDLNADTILITSDTIVWHKNEVLGKPESHQHAVEILKRLSGNMHEVVTGVALTSSEKQRVFHSVTKVWIRDISDEEILYYLDKYKPMDKAGAYGIQEWIGYVAVEQIEGSFHNVMGLPIQMLYKELFAFVQ